uniref:GLTSCR protein conserved domain-containing protein n=1 Tax=Callorhinchus milii TaxID=7868 RepID=A0A4W3JLU4_CALMI
MRAPRPALRNDVCLRPAVGEGNTSQIQSNTSCVDLFFLEDDILGSPANSSVQQNSDEPCDILQQSLQEANITQQTLQEEADLAANVLQAQPYSQLHSATQVTEETLQLFGSGSTDIGGLAQQQPPAIITQQPLLQQPVNAQFVNKTISVQRLIHQVGLNSIAITPIASIQTRSNGSPRRTSIGQIQMVDQHAGQTAMMSIGQHHQQLITKSGQSAQMTTLPPGSYLSAPGVDQQLTVNSSISSQFQKNVAGTNLNGNSLFANVTQASQQVTVRPTINSQVIHTPVSAQNIIQKTPTPIQPKHRVNIQPKLIQISPKPSFSPNSSTLQTALKLQTEAALQQQKAQQNLTFVAGTPSQNVLLSTQGPTVAQSISANLIKQQPQQVQPNVGKPVSVQVLNQGGSIVIQPQSVPQAVMPGTNQFIVPGHTSLPAQILTAQNVAGQLTNFSQVFAAPNAQLAVGQGTTHILSGPLQLQPGQLAQPTLFQMPAQLSGNFPAQSQTSSQPTLVQQGQTIVQGVPVPNQITVLNNSGQLGQSMNVQQSGGNSSSTNIVQKQPSSDAELPTMGNGQPPVLMIQQAQINNLDEGGNLWAHCRTPHPFPPPLSAPPSRFCPILVLLLDVPTFPLCLLLPTAHSHVLLEQFCKDQNSFMQPDCKTAFKTFEDTVFSLLPYHVCKGMLPSEEDFKKVDDEFEAVSAQLLKRTQTMLNKYRLLLFEESRRAKPSAEMVMIDRMFIQDEKVALVEAKQLARERPGEIVFLLLFIDAYISSVFNPSTLPSSSCSSAASTDLVQSSTQISATKLVIKQARNSPSVTWATGSPLSNAEIDVLPSRSKPLKTYVASSRGGLKLKIKHEAGCSKVVHNTALDQLSLPVMSSLSEKSPSNLPVTPLSQSNGNVNCMASPAEKPPKDYLNRNGFPDLITDDSTSNLMKELAAVEDALAQGLMKIESADEVPDLRWELPLSQPKRRKSDSVDNASFSSDSPQDSTLNEHLQSAINSILDLQRLQHSSEEQTTTNNPPDSAEMDIPQFSPMASSEDFIEPESHGGLVGAGTSTLEEAVNSILDD